MYIITQLIPNDTAFEQRLNCRSALRHNDAGKTSSSEAPALINIAEMQSLSEKSSED
jgi:hypothetical protein